MQVFKSPTETLGDLGAQAAAKLIAAATDIALVVDRQGVILDIAFNKDDLALELDGQGRWMGSKLVDIVTSDTQLKIRELLQVAIDRGSTGWRQVNHPSPTGEDVPVQYAAVDYGRDNRLIVVGRDLRQLAQMQRRLVSAQQSMERDYTRLREDLCPDWPQPAQPGGSYRIEITGEPSYAVDVCLGSRLGDHNHAGLVATAMRVVNAIPAVVAAPAGIRTTLDLPLVTGQGLYVPG